MATIPEGQFSVVKDRERNTIVASGTFEECVTVAKVMNEEYQSTAYVVERWRAWND